MTSPALPPGYCRTAPLGRGGTAEVVRAFSAALGREVALKIPLADADPSGAAPFAALVRRERLLIGGRRFPGLVRLIEAGEAPPYVAMEICPGPTLDRLGKIDSLSLALNLLAALTADLEYLRAAGIVHGDLKPQNVFLPAAWEGLDGRQLFWVKLSDFSLGRADGESDSDRAGLGTVGYLAPETIVGGAAEHQSDLFALGVTAYQMLTGLHPFMNGETEPAAINSRCREEEPPQVDTLRPDVPAALSRLIARLLHKDRAQRPVSAWEVCLELERVGAEYPFRRALQPGHFLRAGASWEDARDGLPVEWGDHTDYLAALSWGSPAQLRMILTENFRRGNLVYSDGRFRFQHRPYWPCRLRRAALAEFSAAPRAAQRRLVRDAVLDGQRSPEGTHAAATMLLRPLLRPSTVRRLSAAPAAQAEQEERHAAAARLSVQAGDLERAERCCYQAAILMQKEHRAAAALRLIQTVLDYAALVRREWETVSLMKLRGDLLKTSGDTEAAHRTYLQAAGLYDGRPPDPLLGRIYNSIGDLYKMKQKFAEGIEALERARQIYEAIGDELELSHTVNNIGNMHFVTGRSGEALRHYRRALRIQPHLGSSSEVASTLNNMGAAAGVGGRLRRAATLFRLSLRLQRELGDLGEIARTLNNLGYLLFLLGEKGQSIQLLAESLELNRRIGNRKEILFNLDNLTNVTIGAGRLRESAEYLREGMAIAAEVQDIPHQVIFSRNASVVMRRMGRIREALEYQRAAEAGADRTDDREERIRLQINAASLRAAVGDDDQALALAGSAAREAERIACKAELLNALLLVTRLADEPAREDEAIALVRDLDLTRERLLVRLNRAERRLHSGRAADAAPVVEEFLLEADLGEDLEQPRLLLVRAEYGMAVGRVMDAGADAQRAAALAGQCGLAPEKMSALALLAQRHLAEGEYETAFAVSRQALAIGKAIAESIPDPADRRLYQSARPIQAIAATVKQIQERIGQKRAGRDLTPAR